MQLNWLSNTLNQTATRATEAVKTNAVGSSSLFSIQVLTRVPRTEVQEQNAKLSSYRKYGLSVFTTIIQQITHSLT